MGGGDRETLGWKARFILLFRRRSLDPPGWKNKHEGNYQGRHRRDG